MTESPAKPRHNHTMSFYDDDWARLGELAGAWDVSRSAALRQLLRNATEDNIGLRARILAAVDE